MNSDQLQAMLSGMSAQWQRECAETQMTLGKMIQTLQAIPEGAMVANLGNMHSYRGYYRDLAFEGQSGLKPAAELLAECREAMGRVFEGYKGGDYMMGAKTPVWMADYGRCGWKIMDLFEGGYIETAEDE